MKRQGSCACEISRVERHWPNAEYERQKCKKKLGSIYNGVRISAWPVMHYERVLLEYFCLLTIKLTLISPSSSYI